MALSSFTIGAVNTVGCSSNSTHLTQRQVICPALMLSRQMRARNKSKKVFLFYSGQYIYYKTVVELNYITSHLAYEKELMSFNNATNIPTEQEGGILRVHDNVLLR